MVNMDSRKTGLVAEKRENFAYQASLRYKVPNTHFCGATIIDENHLITSAHCVTNDTNVVNPESVMVVVGDLNILEETSATEYREISYIFTHPDYNPDTFENDIAILRTSQPFESWTQDIKPIEIAETSPEPYLSCVVSGWGSASSPMTPTENLRFEHLPIIENRTCNEKYPDGIKPGMFCAGFLQTGKDACQGDGGGPLVCNNRLSGIVSWGHRCANVGLPGVYTDVSTYTVWIEEQKSRSASSSLRSSPLIFFVSFTILKIFKAL